MATDMAKTEQELKEKFGEDLDDKLLAECMSESLWHACLNSLLVCLSPHMACLRVLRCKGLSDAQLHR